MKIKELGGGPMSGINEQKGQSKNSKDAPDHDTSGEGEMAFRRSSPVYLGTDMTGEYQ